MLNSPKESHGLIESNRMMLSSDEVPNEDYIKVKLYYFTETKSIRSKIFTDEWYTVMEAEYEDQVDRDS